VDALSKIGRVVIQSPSADAFIALVGVGLESMVHAQQIVSANVPNAMDGSRQSVVDYAYALCEEVHEAVREVGWKPWKEPKQIDTTRVVEEMADVVAFMGVLMINLAKACGVPPGRFAGMVGDQYSMTSHRNIQRFVNGREQ
jgi:dimeric dUTPase (all-alpha-NTP-PPase superfamily)